MKNMVRCKACGYIMEEQKLGEKCPACGAPKAAFMPYVDPVADPRRRLLNLHLHPIAVHFPTAFSVAVLVASIVIIFISGNAQTLFISTAKILVLFIPLVVILAGVVGFIDGRTRFRKINNSKILKRKIFYAGIYLIVAIVLAVIVWTEGFESVIFSLLDILLAAIAVGLSANLALLGMSITEAAFPGK